VPFMATPRRRSARLSGKSSTPDVSKSTSYPAELGEFQMS
jgi:hypothetical protein